jgi:NhaP-type Na+/H+ and K+/H+ antiporter
MIDVSELITDPDFAVSATVKRSRTVALANGRERAEDDYFDIAAVIQPATSDEIALISDTSAGRLTETLAIWTNIRLYVGDDRMSADTVFYRGRTYTVVNVDDYMADGNICHALMTRKHHNDRLND